MSSENPAPSAFVETNKTIIYTFMKQVRGEYTTVQLQTDNTGLIITEQKHVPLTVMLEFTRYLSLHLEAEAQQILVQHGDQSQLLIFDPTMHPHCDHAFEQASRIGLIPPGSTLMYLTLRQHGA